MNEAVRSFINHLGFESEIFLDQWQYQFPALATIVGEFIYAKQNEIIKYLFDSWIAKDSFERLGNIVNQRQYLIPNSEFISYRNTHSETFDTLESIAKEIVKKSLIGELDIESEGELPINGMEINLIQVNPTSAFLHFDCLLPDGIKLPFSRSGDAYYEIIGNNTSLVATIVELAKSRSIAHDNFFGLNS